MSDILNKLKEPFPEKLIHWRVGATTKDKKSGIALAYVDARDVMKRLDDVLGAENWKDSYVISPPRNVRKTNPRNNRDQWMEEVNGTVICTLSIRVDDEWISKSDGAGETQVEADKGAISDAFKRAAVKWGPARYLYYLPTVWVELDSYRNIITPPKLPKWALPKE